MYKTRQEISLTARKIVGIEHWIVLATLAGIMIFLVYAMRTSDIVSSIFTVLISTIAFLVLFLLYEIDSNIFAEEKLSYDVFKRTFIEIGKMPYYTYESIQKQRIKPEGQVRVGILENKKSFKRTIKIMKFKK